MIIVVIIFSLIYVILLTLILIAYYRDNRDLEQRLLYLEQRTTQNFKNVSRQIIELQDMYIENNTQKECECDMACGRKKGRGGKRK